MRPPLPPPAMRIKNHWFGSAEAKSPAEQASAMAFIVWRVAHQMLKRLRSADFDIEVGPPTFAFMAEALVFLAAVTDRIAHARLDADARLEFTTALVRHLARIFDENEREFLGPPAPAVAPADERLLALYNEVAAHYADFGADSQAAADAGFEPDFAFVRYFGHRVEGVLPERDRRWVLDQLQAVEAPEALSIVQRSMRNLYDAAPRRARRAAVSGD